MSILVPFNGSDFIIPTPNEIGWGTNLDNYLVAIANGCLQNIGGSFVLSNDADFGGTNGLKSLYYKTRSANIAASGQFRLANAVDSIDWRNAGNSADLSLTVNSSNQLTFNGILLAGAGILTPNRALVSDGSGNVASSSVTNVELGYLSGVTSAIQSQIDSKLNLGGGTLTGDLTFASTKGIFFTDDTTNTVKLTAHNSTTSYSLKWPTSQGASNQYLTNDGSGNLSWTNAAGTGTVNTGVANTLAYYAASTNVVSNLTAITANKALASNSSGLPIASSTTDTELGFVHGVTSSIQTQIDSKLSLSGGSMTGALVNVNASNAAIELDGITASQPIGITIGNTSNTSGADASIFLTTGGSSSGDAFILVSGNGGSSPVWSFGEDTSDVGAFCITAAATLNGSNILRIDPSTHDITVTNDLFTIPWTDYSGTSTIVGWSSFTSKFIYYKKIGKLVYVMWYLVGTSNSTSTSFTLPFSTEATFDKNSIGYALDNGGTAVAGFVSLGAGSATVALSPTVGTGSTTWTNSGNKRSEGQFFYETA